MDPKTLAALARIKKAVARHAPAPVSLPPIVTRYPAGLLPYQVEPAGQLARALRLFDSAGDMSDMGTGKSYQSLAAFRELGIHPLVIAPKAALPAWQRVADHFNWPIQAAIGWEKLRYGNTDFGFWRGEEDFRFRNVRGLIIDEAHRAKSFGSLNSKLVIGARVSGVPCLALSATLAATPLDMYATGYLLGLHQRDDFLNWAANHGCIQDKETHEVVFRGGPADLAKIHGQIFPARGVRVKIADLGDAFPETQLLAQAYDAENTPQIVAAYEEMEAELAELDRRTGHDRHPLAIIVRAQQKMEMLKVPLLISLAQDAISEGRSVAIFVRFTESRELVCQKLGTKCTVHGGQTGTRGGIERQACIDAFQQDRSRVIVLNEAAGGVSLSLHDVRGQYPRLSLISPTFNAFELRQVTGRVHRSGGKSKSLQRIVFVAGTIEEAACRNVARKLANLDALNDGDLAISSAQLTGHEARAA